VLQSSGIPPRPAEVQPTDGGKLDLFVPTVWVSLDETLLLEFPNVVADLLRGDA